MKPYLYVELEGATHFFLTDESKPPGARPDPHAMELDQATSVDSTATWTAPWFQANLGDAAARDALASAAEAGMPAGEPHVGIEYVTA